MVDDGDVGSVMMTLIEESFADELLLKFMLLKLYIQTPLPLKKVSLIWMDASGARTLVGDLNTNQNIIDH